MKNEQPCLEQDLLSSDLIKCKVKTSKQYAQNLYAAMCNNNFVKIQVEDTAENIIKVLSGGLKSWSCSWRYSGGIIARLIGEGDYIDWYCSGIRDIDYSEEVNRVWDSTGYVPEGCITDEVLSDFNALGWTAEAGGDWEHF